MAAFGDSTTEGNVTVTNGGWPEQLRVLAESRWGRGGDGIHPMNRDPWTLTSGGNAWTIATTADAWDCAPLLGSAGNPVAATYLANGSAIIATWTKPVALTTSSFTLHMVDGAGSGNFSYSTDGGSSWTNVSTIWSQNNAVKKIHIQSSVTTTLKVRAANAAGTAVNTYIVGLESHTSSPGFVIHNVAANSEFSYSIVRTTAGNWHAWLDTLQPPLCTFMITNDSVLWETFGDISAGIQANLDAFASTVSGYGGCVLFMNFFEQGGRSVPIQASIRAIVKTVATAYSMPVIDFYDLIGNHAATVAAGYYDNSGDIHENDAGAVYIAQQVWATIARSGFGVSHRIT